MVRLITISTTLTLTTTMDNFLLSGIDLENLSDNQNGIKLERSLMMIGLEKVNNKKINFVKKKKKKCSLFLFFLNEKIFESNFFFLFNPNFFFLCSKFHFFYLILVFFFFFKEHPKHQPKETFLNTFHKQLV